MCRYSDISDDLSLFSVNTNHKTLQRETVTGHQKDMDFTHRNSFYLGKANTSHLRKFFNNMH